MLFLHGLGGSRTAWEPQLEALSARGLRCAAWDMPGYGASAPAEGPLSFDLLVDAVEAWMGALGVARAHVVGLSFGGMVAQHVAVARPERVRSLVLLDSSPAFGFDGATEASEWLAQRLGAIDRGATPATLAPMALPALMGPHPSDGALAQAVAAMARIPPAGWTAAVRCLVTHDLRGELHRIVAPTLVVVGELDDETPPAYSRFLAEEIAEAQLVVLPGCGHLSNLDASEDVNRLLATHFRLDPND